MFHCGIEIRCIASGCLWTHEFNFRLELGICASGTGHSFHYTKNPFTTPRRRPGGLLRSSSTSLRRPLRKHQLRSVGHHAVVPSSGPGRSPEAPRDPADPPAPRARDAPRVGAMDLEFHRFGVDGGCSKTWTSHRKRMDGQLGCFGRWLFFGITAFSVGLVAFSVLSHVGE